MNYTFLTEMLSISAPPSNVAISRSASAGDVEVGTVVTYTCTSTGGDPVPNIRLFAGTTELTSATGPVLAHNVNAGTNLHNANIKCEAFNDHGTVDDAEILLLYRK